MGRDILGRHRLNQYRCKSHRVAVSRGIGDALQELEELRRVDDRVRDRRLLDQFFLGELRSHVATFGEPVCADYGERDVMPHACRRFGVEEVGGRRYRVARLALEKLH